MQPKNKSQSLWRKVPINWSDDLRLLNAPDDQFKLYWYIRTGPYSGFCGGLCRMGLGLIADGFGWDHGRVQKAMDGLVESGLIEFDPVVRLVYLPGVAAALPPSNQHSKQAAVAEAESMPDSPLREKTLAEFRGDYCPPEDLQGAAPVPQECRTTAAQVPQECRTSGAPEALFAKKRKDKNRKDKKGVTSGADVVDEIINDIGERNGFGGES